MTARLRWQVLYETLRDGIEAGDYAPGDPLPTERDLMQQYGCSRETVRRAFAQLEQSGQVDAKPTGRRGGGRVVRHPLDLYFDASKFERIYTDDPEAGRDQWAQDVAAQGWEYHQVPEGEWRPAGRSLARWLDVDLRTPLWRRRRIRSVRKSPETKWAPVIIADSWFPEDIATREVEGFVPLMADHNVTMKGGIIRALGINQKMFEDEIRARMPSDEEASLLKLPPGTPVLELARIGIDQDGRRIRVIVNVLDSNSQYLKYMLDVPEPRRTPTETETP